MLEMPPIRRRPNRSIGRLVRAWPLSIAIATLAVFGACAGEDPTPTNALTPTPPPTPTVAPTQTPVPMLQVVTTTNFMADWVENIGGGQVEVMSLLGEGADPHTY